MTVFIKVLVSDRLPKVSGEYDTSIGNVCFENVNNKFFNHKGELTLDPEWWLEEIEMPSDDEILEAILMKQDKDQTQFMRGIDFILNKLKGE